MLLQLVIDRLSVVRKGGFELGVLAKIAVLLHVDIAPRFLQTAALGVAPGELLVKE